jgi:hypothetical protein
MIIDETPMILGLKNYTANDAEQLSDQACKTLAEKCNIHMVMSTTEKYFHYHLLKLKFTSDSDMSEALRALSPSGFKPWDVLLQEIDVFTVHLLGINATTTKDSLSRHVLNIVPKIKALDLIPTQHKSPNTKLKAIILLHDKTYVDKLCLAKVICINGNVIFIRSSNTTNEQHTWILNNISKDSTEFDILCLISKIDQIHSTSIKCDNTTRRAFVTFDTELSRMTLDKI